MPYLYIDVNINDSEIYTINVCEGDEPEDLAKQFSAQHGFDNQAELLWVFTGFYFLGLNLE